MKIRHPNRCSFTLVEMIVAMAVLSLLTAILFSVLNETSRAISLSSGRTAVYTEVRVVMDQLNREFQQAIDDDRFDCFNGSSDRVNFVATIDNNSGNEEAEVGYYFDGSNLTKTLQFSTINGTNNSAWNVAQEQAGVSTSWSNSPVVSSYITVLENVKSVTFLYLDTNGTAFTAWNFSNNVNRLPAYIETSVVIYDAQDVVRYQGIANVPTNLGRFFTNIVYVPRQ